MLKRFKPALEPDGINRVFTLPLDYAGGSLNVFVNGVLYATEGVTDHPYGFVLSSSTTIQFYVAPAAQDSLFILYESTGEEVLYNVDFSGEIEIEAGKWQLCAIPAKTGYWNAGEFVNPNVISTFSNYVIKQLEDVYAMPADQLIEIANCYIGDNDYYFNYIPGITKETSEHNFQLVYLDNDNDLGDGVPKSEITGFWIKSKAAFPIKIKWKVI